MVADLYVPAEGWTGDEIDALEDLPVHRAEIVDGNLVVSPAPDFWHQDVVVELAVALRAAAPAHLLAVPGAEIRQVDADGLVRQRPIPDVLVAPKVLKEERERPYAVPSDVLLVVEVVSPSSKRRDRLEKPALYAHLGIPAMWLLERDRSLTEYDLRRDAVRIVRTVTGVFRTDMPFPVEIDLDAL